MIDHECAGDEIDLMRALSGEFDSLDAEYKADLLKEIATTLNKLERLRDEYNQLIRKA